MILLLTFPALITSCQRKNSDDSNSTVTSDSDFIVASESDIVESKKDDTAVIKKYDAVISRDPFLLFFLSNYPTLIIDISENVVVQRISYRNYDRKEIVFGDGDRGIFNYSIYLFQNGVFNGRESAAVKDDILLWRYKYIEIDRNTDGTVSTIDQYQTRSDRFLRQNIWEKDGNVLVANEGLLSGPICVVLVEEESKFLYFDNYKDFNTTPDWPDMSIEFINSEDVIISLNLPGPRRVASQHYFTSGILMKREYINSRTETYTVSSGVGEIIVTNTDGEVTERRMLERRMNSAGYLEYEKVIYPSGEGYEYFFTKDTLR